MQERRPGRHRLFGLEDRGKKLVLDLKQTACLFSGAHGLGDNGGNALSDKANNIVKNVGIVGIDKVIFVGRRAVEPTRDILPGENVDDAWNSHSLATVNAADARVRVRRAQYFQMEYRVYGDIEGIAGISSDNRFPKGILQAASTGHTSDIFIGRNNAVNGVSQCFDNQYIDTNCP